MSSIIAHLSSSGAAPSTNGANVAFWMDGRNKLSASALGKTREVSQCSDEMGDANGEWIARI
jgi:hypothetical protein